MTTKGDFDEASAAAADSCVIGVYPDLGVRRGHMGPAARLTRGERLDEQLHRWFVANPEKRALGRVNIVFLPSFARPDGQGSAASTVSRQNRIFDDLCVGKQVSFVCPLAASCEPTFLTNRSVFVLQARKSTSCAHRPPCSPSFSNGCAGSTPTCGRLLRRPPPRRSEVRRAIRSPTSRSLSQNPLSSTVRARWDKMCGSKLFPSLSLRQTVRTSAPTTSVCSDAGHPRLSGTRRYSMTSGITSAPKARPALSVGLAVARRDGRHHRRRHGGRGHGLGREQCRGRLPRLGLQSAHICRVFPCHKGSHAAPPLSARHRRRVAGAMAARECGLTRWCQGGTLHARIYGEDVVFVQ